MNERIAAVAGSATGALRRPATDGENHLAQGREPARELMNWLYEEPRLRILVSSDGEIVWMSRAAQSLPPMAFPFVAAKAGQGGADRRLQPAIISRLAFLDDRRPHCFTSAAAPDWVIWAQSIQADEENGSLGQAFVGLTLRRRGEAPELEALGEACRLTRAEIRIIAALMAGHDTATTAHELGISMHTLRTHVRHAYRKLGVTTREGLFAGALVFMHP